MVRREKEREREEEEKSRAIEGKKRGRVKKIMSLQPLDEERKEKNFFTKVPLC